MAEPIDVDKLKNDAFNAIDALFVEDEESKESEPVAFSDSVEEPSKPEKSELIVSSMDDFTVLDEFILALDWEYSEAEIKRFADHLKNIAANNSNPYNRALVKMLNSIITYLIKARNKAYPETFNTLSELIGILKSINAPEMPTEQIKSQVSTAYKAVKILKKKISVYNSKLSAGQASAGQQRPRRHTPPQQAPAKADTSIETLGAEDFIADDDIFTKKTEAPHPVAGMIEPADLEAIESKIIERLNEYEQRLSLLEKQNLALQQIISDQKQVDLSSMGTEDEPSPVFTPSDPADTFGFDDFVAEFETLSPIEESEPETVDIEEIISRRFDDELTAGPGEDKAFSPAEPDDEAFGAFATDDGSGFPDEAEALGGITDTQDDPLTRARGTEEYVRVFEAGDQKIAISIDHFNNLYKLPSRLRGRIGTLDSLRLGELASVFRRLSRNMKGALQGVREKELKQMTVAVFSPLDKQTSYPFAVLYSNDENRVLIPVSGRHESGNIVSGTRSEMENRISGFSVKIEDEIIPLLIPGQETSI